MAKGNLVKFTAFKSEAEAVAMLESLRWPNGAACPHCGGADPYRLTPKATTKTRTQIGLWKCAACRKKFTVKVGTIFESSHIPVSKWLMALHLISASKKGMSALQFQRMLGMTYRSAWFMAHRLRFAMSQEGTFLLSGIVEADETYVGGKRRVGRYGYEGKGGRPAPHDQFKTPVVAMVERKGRAMAFPMGRIDYTSMREALVSRVVPSETHLMTDELPVYPKTAVDAGFKKHEMIRHLDRKYAKGLVHTNTVEGFFALLTRSAAMKVLVCQRPCGV